MSPKLKRIVKGLNGKQARKRFGLVINPKMNKKGENIFKLKVKGMEKEEFFFEANLKPFVEEIENAALVLNSLCEDIDGGMCFFLKDTLHRIAKEIKGKIDSWEKELVVYKKTEKN